MVRGNIKGSTKGDVLTIICLVLYESSRKDKVKPEEGNSISKACEKFKAIKSKIPFKTHLL